jgi:23S rRNA (uracil1939-C5)-methyltransferase
MQKPTDQISASTDFIELHIESTAFGGKGVARSEGKVYFVEGAVEGDVALVEVISTGERYNEGKVSKLIKPSQYRGPSPCPVSDVCGGCQWQGVPYPIQLEWKKRFIKNSLSRIGKLGDDIEVVVLPSPKQNAYRNRIFLRARLDTAGKIQVGYFRRASRDFVSVENCAIAVDRINRFISELRSTSFKDEVLSLNIQQELKFRFEVQDLPTQNDQARHLLVTVYDGDDPNTDMGPLISTIGKMASVYWCGSSKDIHKAPVVLFDQQLNHTFHTSAGIFQQINIDHNHTARTMVSDVVKAYRPQRILDLFCGSGNLSLALANDERVIDGVEFSKRAIEIAKHNVQLAGLKNINYYSGDTEKFLWRAAKQGMRYDMVIADPPREGMFKSLIPLQKIKPKHIIYISCDPATLSRDLNALCKANYRITRFVALDFFPNTFHIESFVVLERRNEEAVHSS